MNLFDELDSSIDAEVATLPRLPSPPDSLADLDSLIESDPTVRQAAEGFSGALRGFARTVASLPGEVYGGLKTGVGGALTGIGESARSLQRTYGIPVPGEPGRVLTDVATAPLIEAGQSLATEAPQAKSWSEVEDINDVLRVAAHTFGQGLGSAALPVAGSFAGGPFGAGGASYALALGDVTQELREHGIQDDRFAQALAVPIAAFDAASALTMTKPLVREVRKRGIKVLVKWGIEHFMEGGAVEALTETAQGATQTIGTGLRAGQTAAEIMPKLEKRLPEATLSGFVAGGPMEAASSVASRRVASEVPEATLDKLDREIESDLEARVNVAAPAPVQQAPTAVPLPTLDDILARPLPTTESAGRSPAAPAPEPAAAGAGQEALAPAPPSLPQPVGRIAPLPSQRRAEINEDLRKIDDALMDRPDDAALQERRDALLAEVDDLDRGRGLSEQVRIYRPPEPEPEVAPAPAEGTGPTLRSVLSTINAESLFERLGFPKNSTERKKLFYLMAGKNPLLVKSGGVGLDGALMSLKEEGLAEKFGIETEDDLAVAILDKERLRSRAADDLSNDEINRQMEEWYRQRGELVDDDSDVVPFAVARPDVIEFRRALFRAAGYKTPLLPTAPTTAADKRAARLAKALRVPVTFVKGDDAPTPAYTSERGVVVIVSGEADPLSLVVHEAVHVLEKSDAEAFEGLYGELTKHSAAILKAAGAEYRFRARVQGLTELVKRLDANKGDNALMRAEAAAQLAENLSPEVIAQMDRNVLRKLLDAVRDVLRRIQGKGLTEEEAAVRAFATMLEMAAGGKVTKGGKSFAMRVGEIRPVTRKRDIGEAVSGMHKVRGVLFGDGDLVLGDPYTVTHDYIAQKLGRTQEKFTPLWFWQDRVTGEVMFHEASGERAGDASPKTGQLLSRWGATKKRGNWIIEGLRQGAAREGKGSQFAISPSDRSLVDRYWSLQEKLHAAQPSEKETLRKTVLALEGKIRERGIPLRETMGTTNAVPLKRRVSPDEVRQALEFDEKSIPQLLDELADIGEAAKKTPGWPGRDIVALWNDYSGSPSPGDVMRAGMALRHRALNAMTETERKAEANITPRAAFDYLANKGIVATVPKATGVGRFAMAGPKAEDADEGQAASERLSDEEAGRLNAESEAIDKEIDTLEDGDPREQELVDRRTAIDNRLYASWYSELREAIGGRDVDAAMRALGVFAPTDNPLDPGVYLTNEHAKRSTKLDTDKTLTSVYQALAKADDPRDLVTFRFAERKDGTLTLKASGPVAPEVLKRAVNLFDAVAVRMGNKPLSDYVTPPASGPVRGRFAVRTEKTPAGEQTLLDVGRRTVPKTAKSRAGGGLEGTPLGEQKAERAKDEDRKKGQQLGLFAIAPPKDSEAFKKWFGKSAVVDEKGEAKVVYHSTNKDFSEFKKKGLSDGFFFSEGSGVNMAPQLWDQEDPYSAGSSILPVYLSIQNPKTLDAGSIDPAIENGQIAQAKSEGHDGIFYEGVGTWVAFRPEQIKSATGNRGTFSPTDPDIRFAMKPSPYAWKNKEVEERHQKNFGVRPPGIVEKTLDFVTSAWHRATRQYEHLQAGEQFAQLKFDLNKLAKQKSVAGHDAVREIEKITDGLADDDFDLFSRKVFLDDQKYEVAEGRALANGWTPEMVADESPRLDASVDKSETVKAALAARKKAWDSIKQSYIDDMEAIGFNVKDRFKNPAYFRHQVLEYVNAKGLYGTGKKLKTPASRGFLRRREGTTLDINTNYLEAEYEVMAQMLYDIQVARTIASVDQHYNRFEAVKGVAKSRNTSAALELMGEEGFKALNMRQAMAFDRFVKLADGEIEGEDFPLPADGHFEELLIDLQEHAEDVRERKAGLDSDEIAALAREGAFHLPESVAAEIVHYAAWVLQEKPKTLAGATAALLFKGMAAKRKTIKDTLETAGRFTSWQDVAKEKNLVAWQPREGNVFFFAHSIPEQLARQIGEGGLEEIGVPKEKIQQIMAVGGRRREFVVPEEVALTLDNLIKVNETGPVANAARASMGAWKRWTLISPRRVVKYNARNLSGDAEAVFVGNPSAFAKVPRAIAELSGAMMRGREPRGNLRKWFERGGFGSTLQAQELGDVSELEPFQKLSRQHGGMTRIPKAAFKKLWKSTQMATDFREAILRYAAFLDYQGQMKGGKQPSNFGASIREEVMALKNIDDRAYKLQNDLLGAYDEVTVSGQWLRTYMIPFWSWNEVNFRRYQRLFRNAVQDGKTAEHVGRRLAGSIAFRAPYTAYRIGKFAIMAVAFRSALETWNRLMFPDEEDELPKHVTERAHIIFGRDTEGKILYFSRLGALDDVLDWFGLDAAPQHVADYLNGRRSLKEVAVAMAESGPNKLVQGVGPQFKVPAELLTRRQLFPDLFRPRGIRDRGEHVAQALGVEHEYRALTKKPTKDGYAETWRDIFVYRADPLQAGYSYIQDEINRFDERRGRGSDGFWLTPRSDALYNLRLAVRYNDKEAQEHFLNLYLTLGGTARGIRQSFERMHPLGRLAKADQKEFVRTLDTDGKEALARAIRFYDTVLLGEDVKELERRAKYAEREKKETTR